MRHIYPPPHEAFLTRKEKMRGKPGAGEGYNGGPLLPQAGWRQRGVKAQLSPHRII
jgi:hypothetical protein